MRGFGQSTSLSLVGWLWADILLGLFALFLAANTAASAASTQTTPGVDPKVVEFTLAVDGQALLNGTADVKAAEQTRIAGAAQQALSALAPARKVAIVFVYGVHADAATGDLLAKAAIEKLDTGAFQGSTAKAYHELAPGATGTSITLDVYLFY
ncbi:MAG TPA: hypothetical protein VGT60_02960 [Candidatus Limnocylindria bacterium]|nr:hypothetical protein [Candidatus Limnocylindria bacterium]